MRRSQVRPPQPAPVVGADAVVALSVPPCSGRAAGGVPEKLGHTEQRCSVPPGFGCVGAYWRGGAVRARLRSAAGELREVSVPARHCLYLRPKDLALEVAGGGDLGGMLRRSRHVLAVEPEGDWVRVEVRDRDAARALCEPARLIVEGVSADGFTERTRPGGGFFARLGVETFEGDLHPVKRWLIDEAVPIGRPRRLYLDIEAYLPNGMGDFNAARLLCWALVDEGGEVVLDEGEGAEIVGMSGVLDEDNAHSEARLIADLVRALGACDQVLAWNGDRFDFEFLKARAVAVGVDVEWRRWLLLDHMELYRRMNMSASESGDEKQSMALAAIAAVVLGEEKKVDLAEGTHVAWRMWSAGGAERARLVVYCLDDAAKMARIEAETGYVELHQTLCEATGVLPDSRAIGPKAGVESYLMRLGRERGMRFPSFFGPTGYDGAFEGAFVLEPTRRGIVPNVHVFDFSRQYPTSIRTLNLSPETHVPAADVERLRAAGVPLARCPKTGEHFRLDVEGLLPIAIGRVLELRKESDDRKARAAPGTDEWHEADRLSSAYKIAINSFYGVVGSIWSRFFMRAVAEGTSTTGAYLIKRTLEEAEKRGMVPVYGDTDSGFVQAMQAEVAAFVKWCNAELYPALARECGALKCEWKLAYEKAFEVMVLVTAKRYAGRYRHFKGAEPTEASRAEIKGLEYKRGDASKLARAMQAECLDLLLGGGVLKGSLRRPACEHAPERFLQMVDRWRRLILTESLPLSAIVVAKKLSKEPEQYARPKKKDGSLGAFPPQVRAALLARERGRDVGAGVRVEYVVVDARTKQLALAEDYDGTNVDRAHLWETLVFPPTMRVLAACFPAVRWDKWRAVRKHMGAPGQVRLFEY